MHKWLFVCLLATASSNYAQPKKNSFEENLTLRRIAEYWKEGEYGRVQTQIRSFLSEYPSSAHADSLHAMLGDLLFNEKNYAEARLAYLAIQDPLFKEQTEYSLLYCWYQEGRFDEVTTLATSLLERGKAPPEQQLAARFQLADSLFHLGSATERNDVKQQLYNQSISHFKLLTHTSYGEQTVYPLALMYTYLKETEKAAVLYEQLAEAHPDQEEAFLFQAASLYLPTRKDKAIELYGKIYPMKGRFASDAAFNQLQLLFAQKKYKELLTTQEIALPYLSIESLPQVRYYIGKSLFALGDYTHAGVHLLQFVENKSSSEKLVKNAALSLIQCAYETRNLSLFDQALKHLLRLSSHEEGTARALLLHAHLCQEMGELAAARDDLGTLLKTFPHHVDRPQLLYDYALLSAELKQWDQAALSFKEWIDAFPKHSHRSHAYRQLIMSLAHLAKNASAETSLLKKEELAHVLQDVLSQKKLLSAAERKQVHYCLGKTLYDIRQYDEALATLGDYVDSNPVDESVAHAYLLMAYCHLAGDFDPALFTLHAEKALNLNANVPQRERLHLQLYNAYLLLAHKAEDADKPSLMEKAAHHLFCARTEPLQLQNHRWLAHYYLQKVSSSKDLEQDLYLTRAITMMEHLITLTPDESCDIEAETIRLSQLYRASKQHEAAIDLLENLQQNYQIHSDIAWKYQRLSLFELAEHYEAAGYLDEALDVYNQLIDSGSHAYSYFTTAAKFKKCCLSFNRIPIEERTEQSEAIQFICDELKNLQLQRKLATEPWHLEAALAYIDIKVAIAPEEKKQIIQSQLLDQTYDFFASQNDPLVKQYLKSSDQSRTYTQYMQFFDAQCRQLKGESVTSSLEDLMTQGIPPCLKSRVEKAL